MRCACKADARGAIYSLCMAHRVAFTANDFADNAAELAELREKLNAPAMANQELAQAIDEVRGELELNGNPSASAAFEKISDGLERLHRWRAEHESKGAA